MSGNGPIEVESDDHYADVRVNGETVVNVDVNNSGTEATVRVQPGDTFKIDVSE